MLMVVLGAGASYDASPQAEWRPPLAKELFADRFDLRPILASWPPAASIVGRMRSLGLEGGMVEDRLGEFVALARETDDPTYKRDIAALRFYLREVVDTTATAALNAASGLTTYMRLVTRLHDLQVRSKKPVFFVTFNYDTLIEDAIRRRFGFLIENFDDYLRAPMPIFKPHGSVNWTEELPKLPGASTEPIPYMHPLQLNRAHELDLYSSNDASITMTAENRQGAGTNYFSLPALAMPISNKDTFMMPRAHLEELTDRLSEVTAVLIVGWRASETEFTKLCHQRLKGWQQMPSHVITYGADFSAGAEVIKNFSPHLGGLNTEVDIRGFSAAMDDPAHDGLERLFT